MLSFLDAFSGYNQVNMCPSNMEKIVFITPRGLYCYKVMPFGLKNVGATYQRLVTKVFQPILRNTTEMYIDNIVIKRVNRFDHCQHLQEAFDLVRKYRMHLNPLKCAFGVNAENFLGFMVTQWGIEANLNHIQAMPELEPPSNQKEVQRLIGKLAALSRFISRYIDLLQPFFQILRNVGKKKYDEEYQTTFESIKQYLVSPPILSAPVIGKQLFVYLVVSEMGISAILMRLGESQQQHAIYYTSKYFQGADRRYPILEKVALALVVSATRLRPYFQAHLIIVLTNMPLKGTLNKVEMSSRMIKWAIELSEYDIEYKPRFLMKGQILADFIF